MDCRLKHWTTYNKMHQELQGGKKRKEDHKLRMPTEWKSSLDPCAPEAHSHEKHRLEGTSCQPAGLLLLAESDRNRRHLNDY